MELHWLLEFGVHKHSTAVRVSRRQKLADLPQAYWISRSSFHSTCWLWRLSAHNGRSLTCWHVLLLLLTLQIWKDSVFWLIQGKKIWMCFINHHDNTGRKQHVLPGMPLPNTLESSQTQITLVENLNCMVANQGTVEHLICGCSCVAGRWASYLTGVVSISKKCHLFLLFV